MDKEEVEEQWPTINNKYIVHRKIASGLQSRVVLATEKESKIRYAIKIYREKKQKDYFEKFIKLEMDKLSLSKHENIISLKEILIDASYIKPNKNPILINAIVMEYAPYGNFQDFICLVGAFSERVAKYYIKQLILGINYLHSGLNICHRDLKPDNLLIDNNFDLKICDLAMSAELTQPLTNQVGNLQFQAPEIHQALASGYNGREADVFSAGVILFLMLLKQYPFLNTKAYNDSTLQRFWDSQNIYVQRDSSPESLNQSTDSSIKSMNLSQESTRPSSSQQTTISENAVDLITKMLQKDPKNRISLAEIISHPWLSSEEIAKQEVVETMKYKIEYYLEQCKSEHLLKSKQESKASKEGTSSLIFNGCQKFRSMQPNEVEKQIIIEENIKSFLLDTKIRSFKSYDKGEIGIHDLEFQAKTDQNCLPEIKVIAAFLSETHTIQKVELDEKFYKVQKNKDHVDKYMIYLPFEIVQIQCYRYQWKHLRSENTAEGEFLRERYFLTNFDKKQRNEATWTPNLLQNQILTNVMSSSKNRKPNEF